MSGLTQSVSKEYSDIKTDSNRRGYMVYTSSQLLGTDAKGKDGQLHNVGMEQDYFLISPEERVRICQVCSPVYGVITSRMHRIAGTKFVITTERKDEDEIYEKIKQAYDIWKEFKLATDISYITARFKIFQEIKARLPEVLPDLSNFNSALIRWKKKLSMQKNKDCDMVWDWLQEPNANDKWIDFIKKFVFDLHVQGSVAVYKEVINGKVENIYTLPGGSVIPIRDRYISAKNGYIQLTNGGTPQLFWADEVSYATYVPISSRGYGLVPVEALVNKIAEVMLFDKLSASNADMTRMPEKMVIINDVSPFGSAGSDLREYTPLAQKEFMPISEAEQKRIEKKLNTPLQGGVITFSGNSATVIDLSRDNLMEYYRSRQKDIREEVALVFNMSNLEVNLTGSENVSGRNTSETQREVDQGKGIVPVLKLIEQKFTQEILPFRFGEGYMLKAEITKSPDEEINYLTKKINSGLYSVNEIRINDLNEVPFEQSEFNIPRVGVSDKGSETNPLNIKNS